METRRTFESFAEAKYYACDTSKRYGLESTVKREGEQWVVVMDLEALIRAEKDEATDIELALRDDDVRNAGYIHESEAKGDVRMESSVDDDRDDDTTRE